MNGRAIPTTSYDRYRRVALQLCRAIGMPVAETEFDHHYANDRGELVISVGMFFGTGPTAKDALAGLVAELRIAARGALCFARTRVDTLEFAETAVDNLGFCPMFAPVALCSKCGREWYYEFGEWPDSEPPTRACVCGETVTRERELRCAL